MKKRVLIPGLSGAFPWRSVHAEKHANEDDHIAAGQVPSAVMSAFNIRYPNAGGEIEWEVEHGNEFKVKFFNGSVRWEAVLPPMAVL